MDLETLDSLIANPHFKPYVAFLKQARDFSSKAPIIAYWSLYHVVSLSMAAPADQATVLRPYLAKLMTCLENEKKAHKDDPLFAKEENARAFIENYAQQLMTKAEGDAELEMATPVTLKLYVSASNLYQILSAFGPLSEEHAKLSKYCKWKAVTIAKEAKEGKPANARPTQPSTPPPPAQPPSYEQHQSDNEGDNNSDNFDPLVQPPPASSAVAPLEPPSIEDLDFDPAALGNVTKSDLKKAELLCESSLYAIKENDVYTAVMNLRQTIQVLTRHAASGATSSKWLGKSCAITKELETFALFHKSQFQS